jgi:hypothetical protein
MEDLCMKPNSEVPNRRVGRSNGLANPTVISLPRLGVLQQCYFYGAEAIAAAVR